MTRPYVASRSGEPLHRRSFDVLVPLSEVWEHARGMPDIDVARLGRATARTQRVRLFDATEG